MEKPGSSVGEAVGVEVDVIAGVSCDVGASVAAGTDAAAVVGLPVVRRVAEGICRGTVSEGAGCVPAPV